MSASAKRRPVRRPGAAPKIAATTRTNKAKNTPASAPAARLVLPAQLDERLAVIEARLAAVEQLSICAVACGSSCPWQHACAARGVQS